MEAVAERTGIEPATWVPGSDLLSRSRTLHYHRRDCISLLCSEWEQVVLQHCGRRAKRVITCACCKVFFITGFHCTVKHSGVVRSGLTVH